MTAGPMFAAGDPIEVLAGMSKGSRGRIAGITPHRYGDEEVYDVKLETGYTRPIREDYLRLLEVPS